MQSEASKVGEVSLACSLLKMKGQELHLSNACRLFLRLPQNRYSMEETDVHRLHNRDNQQVTNRYYATHAELPEGTGPISTATNNTSIETYKSLKKDRINQSQCNIAKTRGRKSSREFFDDILKYVLT